MTHSAILTESVMLLLTLFTKMPNTANVAPNQKCQKL